MSTIGKQSTKSDSALRFQRILVAVDGSEGARRASEVAVDLAEKFNAQLYVLYTFRGYPEYMTMFPSAPSPSGGGHSRVRSLCEKGCFGGHRADCVNG